MAWQSASHSAAQGMKQKLVVIFTVILSLFSGCSSHSPKASAASTDLGIVEMARFREKRQYSLSGGRDCLLTLTALADGQVLVEAVVLRKYDENNINVLAGPRTVGSFGEKVSLPIDDGKIVVTPKRK
jgi:hypothetical protein